MTDVKLMVVRNGYTDGNGYDVFVGGKRKGRVMDHDMTKRGLGARPAVALSLARCWFAEMLLACALYESITEK